MTKPINRFTGDYRFLSNFYHSPVTLDGVEYPSVENAYQAAKTLKLGDRRKFRTLSAGDAKKAGRQLDLRRDWEHVKLTIMENLLILKFDDDELGAKLLATGDAQLIEGNDWGDRYWGSVDGRGENHLGRLLMRVRARLRRTRD